MIMPGTELNVPHTFNLLKEQIWYNHISTAAYQNMETKISATR
jgi:hypothetical protein